MKWKKKSKEKKNKYNAKKVTIDGIEFDSKREGRMYSMLKKFNIPLEMQFRVILQEKFKCSEGKTIQPISSYVDFKVPYQGINLYIDTKGVITKDAALKFKMLKHKIMLEGNKDRVFLPSTDKEVDSLVIKISNNLI